jgi:hypothetical protein
VNVALAGSDEATQRLIGLALAACAALALGGCAKDSTAPATEADSTFQFISVRRAWMPGERDSVAAYVVRTGAWDEYSDIAPLAYATWDSAVDIIQNPAWRPPAAAVQRVEQSPEFAAGWGGIGMVIRIVFDTVPGGTVQADSLDWVTTRWWNPADSTWKGFMINATTASTFGKQNVNTTAFDASGGTSGVGGGEARLASLTYWQANGGSYRITQNGSYGSYQQITAGPYKGGDVAFGLQAGQLTNIVMPRQAGADTPATQTFSWNFASAPINSQQIRCYFVPVTPPTGFHQCTGQAFARLVAAAQAHRLTATMAAGLADSLFLAAQSPRAPRTGRRRRRPLRRTASIDESFGLIFAVRGREPAGGIP